MRNVFTYINKNIAVLNLAVALVSALLLIFATYITYRIAPVTSYIDQVNAQTVSNTKNIKDDENIYIPMLIQNSEDIKNLKESVNRIDKNTQEMYRILIRK